MDIIIKIYVAQFGADKVSGRGVIELAGAALRAMGVGVELTDEFVQTIPRDEKYEIRMHGLLTMRSAFSLGLSGYVNIFSESKNYTRDERVRFVELCRESYPGIFPFLTPATREEILLRLSQLCKGPAMKELKP